MKADMNGIKLEGTVEEFVELFSIDSMRGLLKSLKTDEDPKLVEIPQTETKTKTPISRQSKSALRSNSWTENDCALLMDMKAKGKTYRQIARKLKRSYSAVKTRYCILLKNKETPPSSSGPAPVKRERGKHHKYTAAEIKLIDTLLDSGKSATDAAKEIGVTEKGMKIYLYRYHYDIYKKALIKGPYKPKIGSKGVHTPSPSRTKKYKRWSKNDVEQALRELRNGADPKRVAKLLKTSLPALESKIRRVNSGAYNKYFKGIEPAPKKKGAMEALGFKIGRYSNDL